VLGGGSNDGLEGSSGKQLHFPTRETQPMSVLLSTFSSNICGFSLLPVELLLLDVTYYCSMTHDNDDHDNDE
jgi:hypothetical protein